MFHLISDRPIDTQGKQHSNVKAGAMSLKDDNFTLAAEKANESLENGVSLRNAPSQGGSMYEQHVFKLVIAYNELDILAKSLRIQPEVTVLAKIRYSQIYNLSDFEGPSFHHDTIIAGCLYIACREKNQQREMPKVFESTRATTEEMLSACDAMTDFFARHKEPEILPSEAANRLDSAYEEIISLSNSNSISPHVSNHARHLYKTIYVSGSFKDQDQKLIVIACLLVACRQMNVSRTFQEMFATIPGVTKADMERTFSLLKEFFAEENREKTAEIQLGTSPPTNLDVHRTEQIVHTLQELISELTSEETTTSMTQDGAVIKGSFTPTAPTLASKATPDLEDTEGITGCAEETPHGGKQT